MKVWYDEEIISETPKTLVFKNKTYNYVEYSTKNNHSGLYLPVKGNPITISNYAQAVGTFKRTQREQEHKLVSFASIAEGDERMDIFNVMGFYFYNDAFIFQVEPDATSPEERLKLFLTALYNKEPSKKRKLRPRSINVIKRGKGDLPSKPRDCIHCGKEVTDKDEHYEIGDPVYLHVNCEDAFINYVIATLQQIMWTRSIKKQNQQILAMCEKISNDGFQSVYYFLGRSQPKFLTKFKKWVMKD